MGLTKPSGGGGAKRGADLQQLRYERRIVWNPVAHDNAAAWFGNAHHLLGDIEGLGRKHSAKHGHDHIKRMVVNAVQVARVSFLKLQPAETVFRGPFVSGFHQVPGDVDSGHVRARAGQRDRRGRGYFDAM